MRRFAVAVACAVLGAIACALAGYALIELLSSNTHDRDMEAAMTGIFVCGPLGALVGFATGLYVGRKRLAPAVVPDAG